MNSIKVQKDVTLKDASPTSKVSNMLLGKSGGELLITPERMKQLGQSKNDAQLWMCVVMEVKSDAAKSSIAQEPEMLGPWIKISWTWSSSW